jgi:hypothetical protein
MRRVRFDGPASLQDAGCGRQQSLETAVVVARERHRLPARLVAEDQPRAQRLRAQPHPACHLDEPYA